MLSKVYSSQVVGLTSHIVEIEVDISRGLHSFSIVGLPDKVIEESKERLSVAIKNSGFIPPSRGNKKIIVSLAPANLKKEGALFDLGIAVGILKAHSEIICDTNKKIFLGELALNGELRRVNGILLATKQAKDSGFLEIYVPLENAVEAALIEGIAVYPVKNLKELVLHLETNEENYTKISQQKKTKISYTHNTAEVDFSDIYAQEHGKRALEIAASGGHNVALYGPPGTGKTLLAKALIGILPQLSFSDVITVTGIYSAAGLLSNKIIINPPFKAPHHTASYVALVGGGTFPKPGEITLSHRGVLFLDEFPEFEKRVIDSLRQPIEDHFVHISRSKESVTFPAHFILVTAMNLCPCGNTGLTHKDCVCAPYSLLKYKRKISGPIIDRIDLWANVPEVPVEKLSRKIESENSNSVRKRVLRARALQKIFFKKKKVTLGTISDANVRQIKKLLSPTSEIIDILNESARNIGLTARSYHKVLKTAFTIATLENTTEIKRQHVLEALQYRPKEFT